MVGNFISLNGEQLLASAFPSVFAPTGMSTGPTGVLEHTSRELAWMGKINL